MIRRMLLTQLKLPDLFLLRRKKFMTSMMRMILIMITPAAMLTADTEGEEKRGRVQRIPMMERGSMMIHTQPRMLTAVLTLIMQPKLSSLSWSNMLEFG